MDPHSHLPCNNNSLDGLTIVPWLAWAMLVAVSRIRLSPVLRSKAETIFNQIENDPCAKEHP